MPFLNKSIYNRNYNISGIPISVIASFKPDGDFIPLYFCYDDENQERHKYKITAVNAVKDRFNIKSFECCFIESGYIRTVTLSCNITEHSWVVE